LIYIKTYYDLRETEALLSLIDSTLHFINNNKAVIRDDIAANYNTSLKLIKKLISAKENNDFNEIQLILKSTENNKNLFLSEWLLEKIDEFKKRK